MYLSLLLSCILIFTAFLAEPYVPGSFAKKQISKIYSDKLRFHNSWEDSVSLFYSWLKKEEGSVKDKQIQVGDVAAITKAIKDAEVTPWKRLNLTVAFKFPPFAGVLQWIEVEEAAHGRTLSECGEGVCWQGESMQWWYVVIIITPPTFIPFDTRTYTYFGSR